MKRTAAFIVALIVAAAAVAQNTEIEKTFARDKSKYTVEHFSEGEDASSGYDYLFYKSGTKIVKLRSIWSASYSKELRIEDLYFSDDLILLRRTRAPKARLRLLKRGGEIVLTPKEELHFSGGKLVKWISDGKAVPTTDANWGETEKATIEHAKSQRDYYKWLKEGKF